MGIMKDTTRTERMKAVKAETKKGKNPSKVLSEGYKNNKKKGK